MFLSKRINTTIFPDGCFTRNNFKEGKGKLNQIPQGKMPFAVLFLKKKKHLYSIFSKENTLEPWATNSLKIIKWFCLNFF